MIVWGITGVIGSGKSTACNYLKSKGYPVCDADQVARLVVDRNTAEGKEGFAQIYKAFGATVLNKVGQLDRAALRKRMMTNPPDRDTLEAILHPLIRDYIQNIMRQWKTQNVEIGFIEGARLVESGFHKMLAGIIIVTASNEQRIKRLMKRDSMAEDEVRMMFGLQDESFMRRDSKVEWKNEKKEDVFFKQIDAFLDAKLKKA